LSSVSEFSPGLAAGHGLPHRADLARLLVSIGVPVLLALGTAVPLAWLIGNSLNTALPSQTPSYGIENWVRAFSQPRTLESLATTFALGAARVVLSFPIAVALVWLITRTDMPGRSLVEAICWLGVFIPTLPLVLGWVLMLDPTFGVVNTLWRSLPFADGPLFNLYSFAGITWVHLASGSVYYKVILLIPAFRRLSAVTEEAAWVSGASRFKAVVRVTIPLLAPAFLAIAFLSFIRSLEAFEVELLLGIPAKIYVFSTLIYDLIRAEPSRPGDATALGSVFLVVMLALALVYQRYLRGRQFTTVTSSGYSTRPIRLGRWRWPATLACFGYVVITLAAPLGFLVTGSFMRRYGFFQVRDPFTLSHWQAVFGDAVFLPSLWNSLILATGTGLLVLLVYSLVGYVIVRSKLPTANLVDLLAWLPLAIPGVLLSLGFLWLFLSTPLRTVLYGTLSGMMVALLIKDSPTATQLFKAAYLQLSPDLEEAGRMAGASWLTVYRRIFLPLLAPSLLTLWLLTFASSLRDISTTVLLYSPQSRPLSLLMLEYSFTGQLERGSIVGIIIAVFVMLLMVLSRGWARRVARDRT
jgi:iron(III) transport system permease protein